MIPPPAQRQMSEAAGSTVVEVAASHSVYVSQPAAVAELIEKAASEVRSAVHSIRRGSRSSGSRRGSRRFPRLERRA